MSLLKKIFSVENSSSHKIFNFLIFKLKVNLEKIHDSLIYKIYSDLINVCQEKFEIYQVHKHLKPFKNKHKNKEAVIIATGPTLQFYKQFKGKIHIGVNKSFMSNIKLDYLFMQDYIATQNYIKDASDYNCIKFYGKFLDKSTKPIEIPEDICLQAKAIRYYNNYPSDAINNDIKFSALMDFGSVVFPAIQLALYMGFSTIYLAGCDCSNNGYFDKTMQRINLNYSKTYYGYERLKEFVKKYYPKVKLISINPIGLKGLFKDIYTQDYINQVPDIDMDSIEIIR